MKRTFIVLSLILSGTVASAQVNPATYAPDMKRFAKEDSIHAPAAGMIVLAGSSSFTKWKDVGDYFPGYKILNRGFGGSQFTDLIYYAPTMIYPYKPKQVFVYEGDNDLASGKEPAEVLANAKTLREKIKENLPGIPVYFLAAKPSPSRWKLADKYRTYNALLKAYAKEDKDTYFIDIWTPMIGSDGKPLPVFLEDNLHMTAAGYKIWQKVLANWFRK